MSRKYKIVFLDIDGTLVDSKKEILPRTYNALMKLQEDGVKLAIASGRPEKGVKPFAEKLKLAEYGGYIMPFNGCRIINCRTNELVFENALTIDTLKKAYALSKKYNIEMLTYKGDYILAENNTDKYILIESTINKMDIIKVDNTMDAVEGNPVKCLLVGDGEYLGSIESKIWDEIGRENANVFRSEPFFIEVVPQGLDKAAAINELIKKIGITQEETIAFGDGYNDVSMIKYAGLGVAMANGCDLIKSSSDIITSDNDHDGIAEVIEKLYMENKI